MEEKLGIVLIQTSLYWENPDENRKMLEDKIRSITSEVALIVLPEMFTTGFTMNTGAAETMDGITVKWMRQLAMKKNVAITGSIIITASGHYYNRLLFVTPDGAIQYYDKRHLFTLAKEDKTFFPGKVSPVIVYKGWSIKPLICYDLRFPVWARNTENYDILLFVANWPKPRIAAWDTLLKARAIENMCYTIGVNRVGFDDKGHEYTGHSAVYDVLGKPLVTVPEERETLIFVSLEKSLLQRTRDKLGFLDDRDSFTLI